MDSSIYIFQPFDIQAYFSAADNVYYVSKNIQIENIDINTFVEVLVKGMINLFYVEIADEQYLSEKYYEYNGYLQYFIFEYPNGKQVLVSKKPDMIVDKYNVVHDTKYKGVVACTFDSVFDIAKNYKQIDFNQKTMVHLAEKYHTSVCTTGEDCIIFRIAKPDNFGFKFHFSPYIIHLFVITKMWKSSRNLFFTRSKSKRVCNCFILVKKLFRIWV